MALPLRNGRLRISQGTLFWREVGRGTTLVLLHGSWSDSSQWLALMTALGRHYHCVAPDLLGFGESSQPRSVAYSVALQVDCLAEFLQALRLRSVVFIADSLGAWVATQYAQRHPNQVRGLVLAAPEGVSTPALAGRWRHTRWLARRWSPAIAGIRLLAPLLRLLGHSRRLQALWQRRQCLRRYAPACRILFQRRSAELQAEYLNAQLSLLQPPVLLLLPSSASATTQLLSRTYADLVRQCRTESVAASEKTLWQPESHRLEFLQAFIESVVVPVPASTLGSSTV